ncbi:50S ribosomal protein L13 [Candidatus Kaiserbacteria bacterium]|nr:50S ribosomal protein L13 [Candidatus Kaiserbacteria bacterium]
MTTPKTTTHTIDAAGKTLGRVAAEAAKALMGKTRADYTPNVRSDVKVTITNADKLFIRGTKKAQKVYTTYSGYPGGLYKESLQQMINRGGNAMALRTAIERMLPRNTMRTPRLKNLTISA